MFVTTVSRQRGQCTKFFVVRDRAIVVSLTGYYAKKRILEVPKMIEKLGKNQDVEILGSTRTFNLPYEGRGLTKLKTEQPKIDVSFKFIKVSNVKKHMLLLGDYAFAQTTSDHRYWNCSKKSSKRKCSAKLRFDNAMNIVHYDLRHNHLPPRFYQKPNGEYARIKS